MGMTSQEKSMLYRMSKKSCLISIVYLPYTLYLLPRLFGHTVAPIPEASKVLSHALRLVLNESEVSAYLLTGLLRKRSLTSITHSVSINGPDI